MKGSTLCVVATFLLLAATGLCWGEGEIAVCTVSNPQMNPSCGGDRVVWMDRRYPDPDLPNTLWDIYMYDITTGVETAVCTDMGDQILPAIDGDRIVWVDQSTGSDELYVYNIPSATKRKIADISTENVYNSGGPDISGDLVVWADDRYNPTDHSLDVLLYDLSNDTLTRITSGPGQHGIAGGPRVNNGRIVWCDTRDDPAGDIYLYDIATDAESVVATASSDSQPDIFGDDVVWTQGIAEGVWNIYYRNVTSPDAPIQLDASSAAQMCPSVAGRWVVWSDYRYGSKETGASDVYVYDLVEHQVRSLTGGNATADYKHSVSASGNVAWMDWRNGDRATWENSDIYGYILTRFSDVPMDYWAYDAIDACVSAGIVSGYPEGDYKPTAEVTRDQMAVYIARALAGGESGVPTFTDTPTFPDVADGNWALKYVEYAAAQAVVTGYEDGNYHPEYQVNRAQMAVYVARAMVAPSGEAGLADYTPSDPRNFADVPSDFWSYRHVEYCVENGVVNGYGDGLYHPEYIVTRDQMAVYVARAFGLGI